MAVGIAALGLALPAQASFYGALTNFDVVNDTGEECHGFEIEVEDCYSRDISYCYSYNHYGKPRLEDDDSDPAHHKCRIRYESKKNPDGSWASYTAIPDGPIDPTNGHMFTNPNINFGGEHFGVGLRSNHGEVRYFWLLDDGAGNLVRGPLVKMGSPRFNYVAPGGGAGPRVNAVIEPPEPPEFHPKEFGDAMWVKVTRTETHNNQEIKLEELVSDDPDDPDDRNWQNGEPAEIEIEWKLLQEEFNQDNGGGNGQFENEAQELEDGDEIVTYRYDFFEYAGPYDPESGEAWCDNVGPDDNHGEGTKTDDNGNLVLDFSTVVVVGDYIGAQMAGFDPAGQLGLVDNLQEAFAGEPYIERTMVVGGVPPIVATVEGVLPDGMTFDAVDGILSGTPLDSGVFTFAIQATDAAGGDVMKTYDLQVVGEDVVDLPPVVEVLNPLDGDVVFNSILIEASAVDDFEVTSVAFTVDGDTIWENGAPYRTNWDTTTVADGDHTIIVYGYDNAGNEGASAPVVVTVDNATPRIFSDPPLVAEAGYLYKYPYVVTGAPELKIGIPVRPNGLRVNRNLGEVRWRPDGTQLGIHDVKLRVKNDFGRVFQEWQIEVVDTKAPSRPNNLVATDITSDSIGFEWTASTDKAGVAGYIVWEWYRNSKEDKGWRIRDGFVLTNHYMATGLPAGKIQRFRVQAFDETGNMSHWSRLIKVTTLP
jgi:hypothetical protein